MNNDIVTKARLNAALGTEGNMGFEHNDIVTVDKMNGAIAEGGGGSSDFSTAQVTIVNNGSNEYAGDIPYIAASPLGENLDTKLYVGAGDSGTYTCVLYNGSASLDVYGWSVTLEGGVESISDNVYITGDCTITLTDAA